MSKNKGLNTKELRTKTVNEIDKLLREQLLNKAQQELDLATGKSKNTNVVNGTRKAIARMKTVLAEKRILANLEVKPENK